MFRVMSNEYRFHLHRLAETLVTPERFYSGRITLMARIEVAHIDTDRLRSIVEESSRQAAEDHHDHSA